MCDTLDSAIAKHSSAEVIGDEMETSTNNDVTAAAETQISFAMTSLDSALNAWIADNTILVSERDTDIGTVTSKSLCRCCGQCKPDVGRDHELLDHEAPSILRRTSSRRNGEIETQELHYLPCQW